MQIKQFFKSGITLAALAVGILGVLIVLYAWQLPPFRSSVETTNNAYVKGQVTLLSPQIAGYVVDVPVQDYMKVRKGDLLVQIDDRIYQQQLAQAQATLQQQQASLDNFAENRAAKQASLDLAKAQLQSAQAGLEKAELDDKRTGTLVDRGFSTQSSGDQARVARLQAQSTVAQAEASVKIAEQNLALTDAGKSSLEAAVASAEAAVRLAEINLGNTRIVAPVDGRLGEVAARIGQYASAGTQLTSITPDTTWVIANFKETQLTNVAVGLPVTFTVDALGGAELTGRVARIAPAAGSEFSVLKADNATGNFTKVAQRIPLRIEIDGGQSAAVDLRPGMSVIVKIDTADKPLPALASAE
ncbi:HlyD family secretion protein [Kaistia nematophila]|uniref:HlyD family secretion protein n=1 Tax=Kaistia nematophila TaxID=2994654 RepID=A0A9X3E180_9HYPH|nr:HlyD family secretion protein [Kaistia nematophila]MCX5569504.1 HlyD family secretion protein [Kaistia nematophila]